MHEVNTDQIAFLLTLACLVVGLLLFNEIMEDSIQQQLEDKNEDDDIY